MRINKPTFFICGWILILFTKETNGRSTEEVPGVISPREPSEAIRIITGLLQSRGIFPPTLLNAAKTANSSADVESLVACGTAIPVKGSLHCLKEYHQGVNRFTAVVPYNETQYCPEGYEVGMSCAGVDNSFENLVSTDVGVLTDESYGVAWIHPITPGETITLTFTFPAPFKVYSMIMVVDTVPIQIIISGSVGGEAAVHFFTHQLEDCSGQEKCSSNTKLQFGLVNVRLSHSTPVLVDKLMVAFPGKTQWLQYETDYLLIKEIRFDSECACERGNCSTTIVNSIPLSVSAQYSCTCPSGFDGFLCDRCVSSFYPLNGRCIACECGIGANNTQCDSEGVCECNQDLYDSTHSWDSKCQMPYITDIEPEVGPLNGGTRVTLTGGLLTHLNLPYCQRLEEVECLVDYPNRDAMAVCVTTPGPDADTKVTFANFTNSRGEVTTYDFLYGKSFEVTRLEPKEAFGSGGRSITLTGSNLQYATSISLIYLVNCLLDSPPNSFLLNQTECQHITGTDTAICKSPSFCLIRNTCEELGREKQTNYCFNKNGIPESLAFTIHSVRISVYVEINGQHTSVNGSRMSPFTVVKDPSIFRWTQLSRQLPSHAQTISIPGENLNSGADIDDYKVEIAGVNAPVLTLNNSMLIASWPDSKPVGNTTVTVGSIFEWVGELSIEQPFPVVEIVVPIVVCVVILIIIIPLLVVILRKRHKRALERSVLKLAYKPGNVRYVNRKGELAFIPLGNLVSDTQLVEQLKPFLIDKERLSLSTQLGAGQFGKVFKGTVQFNDNTYVTVAAKTLKVDVGVTEETVSNFLKEATLMSNFNHHNVLSLIGVVYAQGNMPIVVLPYMHLGDVRGLVQTTDEVLVLGDLLHFAMQVGRGMQYLAERRFIHRDLAARNCMVDENYVVKIADFGLSHDIYEDDYYRVDETSTKPLPVKWMAIESLNSGRFTTHSDVWSYGVVMWELLTRGLTPYPAVSNYEIKSHLNGGERLTQPDYCPPIIYEMMRACWHTDPNSRPTFEELADKLSDILEDANYENRSKTKDIQSDYYKQPASLDNLAQLYVDIID